MGRLITLLTFIIFIEMLFIATGQLCQAEVGCSFTSNLFNAIMSFSTGDLTNTSLATELLGSLADLFNSTTGLLALTATGAVFVGTFLKTGEFRILLIPITFVFIVITSDWLLISSKLTQINPVLGIIMMAPISIVYIFTVLEWWRGND